MIRVRTKDSKLGLFVGFSIGVIVVIIFMIFKFADLHDRFFSDDIKEIGRVEVFFASRDIIKGEEISQDDFYVLRSKNYKDIGISSEYIIGEKASINIDKDSIITYEMLGENDLSTSLLRLYESDFISVMKNVNVSDLVDIRISFPNGNDFIVISAKEVMDLNRVDQEKKAYISLALSEKEILSLASAYNDYKLLEGVKIYTAKYVDKYKQKKAFVNYPVNKYIAQIILESEDVHDKNIVNTRHLIDQCYRTQLNKMKSIDEMNDDFDLMEEGFYDGDFENVDLDF